MQAVLCASLCLTTALAWWLGHVHAATLQPKLAAPHTFVNLVANVELRLPVDWKIEAYSTDADSAELHVIEEKSRYGSRRVVSLFVQRLPSDEPLIDADQQLNRDMNNRAPSLSSKIEIMGQPGVLKVYPSLIAETGMGRSVRALICAYVVVPGPRPALVALRMIGPLTFAPADVELLKDMAQSLQPSNSSHPAPQLAVPVFKSREFRPAARESGQNQDNDPND